MNQKKISPHVQIYKFPITAISSISTRLSGFYLTGCFIGFGISKLSNYDVYKEYKLLNSYQQKFINYSIIVPVNFHTLSGIRHFVVDKYPSLLTNNKMAYSSWLLFSSTAITSILVENYLDKYRLLL